MTTAFHSHSPVWQRYPPSLTSSSNGTSKHLSLIAKAAARDRKKGKKQRGNPTQPLTFSVMSLPMRNQSAPTRHTWTPCFYSQPLSQPLSFCLYLNIVAPVIGELQQEPSWGQLWQLGHIWEPVDPLGTADFSDKWEAESLSLISLSVSMLEVPRRHGLKGKTRPGLPVERKPRANQSLR